MDNMELSNILNGGNVSIEDIRKLYLTMEMNQLLEKYNFPDKPSKDGYYRLYVPDVTKKAGRRQLTGKTLEELKNKVCDYEKGINGHTRKVFKDVFEIVQQEKLRYIKNPQKRLSVLNTIGRNRSEYKRFFGDTAFEKKFMEDITKKDLEAVVLMNLKRYNLHKKGLASMRAILKSIFDLAFSEYWIDDNVYQRIDFKKFADMIVPSVPVEERVHDEDEVKRILDYIHAYEQKKPNYMPAWALELQIIAGMRRGELPPLLWSDIREDHLWIHRSQITVKAHDGIPEHDEIVEHTKNYKTRKFPRTDLFEDYLKRLAQAQSKYRKSEFLFPADTPNGCISNAVVYEFYRRLLQKLAIQQEQGVIKGTHSFRRNAITEVVNKTHGNLIMASQLFGNTPDVARSNYYTGLDLDDARRILNG